MIPSNFTGVRDTCSIKEFYINGLQSGLTTTRYPNGNIRTRAFYTNGHRTGEFQHFNEQGDLIAHHFTKKGIRIDFKEEPYPILPKDRYHFVTKYKVIGTLLPKDWNMQHPILHMFTVEQRDRFIFYKNLWMSGKKTKCAPKVNAMEILKNGLGLSDVQAQTVLIIT